MSNAVQKGDRVGRYQPREPFKQCFPRTHVNIDELRPLFEHSFSRFAQRVRCTYVTNYKLNGPSVPHTHISLASRHLHTPIAVYMYSECARNNTKQNKKKEINIQTHFINRFRIFDARSALRRACVRQRL